MKLSEEAGFCNEVDFDVVMLRIEELQDRLAEEKHFTPLRHKLQIFGVCGKCSK